MSSSRRQTMSKQRSTKQRKSKGGSGALVLDEVFGGGGGGGMGDDSEGDNLKLNLEDSSSSSESEEESSDPAKQAKKLQDKAHARAMRALELCETASAGGSIKRDRSFRNPKSSSRSNNRRSTMNPNNGSGSNFSSPKASGGRKSVMADFLGNQQQSSSPIRGRSDHSRGSRNSIGSRNGHNSSSGMFSIGENSGGDDDSDDDRHHHHSNKKGFLDLSFGGDESERSDIIGAYTSALTNDALNDVTLEGNDGIKVGANRAILASKNRVFQRLLLGSFVMTAEGSFRSVKINFRGKVLRAVVEFILTDNTKVLDIRDKEEIKKQTAQIQAKAAQAQQEASKRRGLFGFFGGGGNVSSNSSIRSTSTHGTRSSAASSTATYTRPQIMTLVSLTRAAVYFKIPALGIQARDTLKHFLQRSPVSSFCVFDACRQEPEAVPKEIVGVALSGIRNYVGYPNIKTESVDFLSPPTMMEILQDDKLRMDDYQLFQIVQRWASSKENISLIGNMGGNSKLDDQTEATAATATETEGSDDEQNHHTPRRSNSSTNNKENNKNGIKSKSISCRERKQMAMNLFMPLIRLECIDPPVLATSVANSDLITQEQLLRAFQQQALAAHLRANLAFQRPRTTDARWKGSMSNLFISRFDNEFKEDVVNDYPPIQDGIHQWTINVEESQDFTWLGICITKYLVEDMDTSSTENDPDHGEEQDVGAIRQDQQWVYSNGGEALHGGKVVDLGGGRTLPFYGTGAQITFTLYLHWKDHGTLIANVDGGRDFVIFSNLRKCLQEGGGEGFVPMVSMYSPGSVRLVDIRHVRQTPFVLERLSNAVGSTPVRSSLSEKDLEDDIRFLNSALRSTRR